MFTTLGAALSTLTSLQVVAVVAITLIVIATPIAIYKGVKNRKQIGNSVGNFVSKLKPSNWGSKPQIVEAAS